MEATSCFYLSLSRLQSEVRITFTHNLLLISAFLSPQSILRLLLLSLHDPQLFFQLLRLILSLDSFGLGVLKG